MAHLRYSPTIKRLIRQDPPEELGKPTRLYLEEAVREGRVNEAMQWLDYLIAEVAGIHYLLSAWNWYMVRYYLERVGEDAWPALLRESMALWLGTTAGLPGQPVADVITAGRNARLIVPGLPREVHLTEGEKRFHLTLDSPAEQEARRTAMRAEMDAAIAASDLTGFNRILDGWRVEDRFIHDVLSDWTWAMMSVLGRRWGEASLGEIQRATEEPWVTVRYAAIRDISPEESLQLSVEAHRGHFAGLSREGAVTVVDESDRYVIQLDQCGSGGRMVQGDPVVGNGSRIDPPYNFLMLEGAYDWTWGICGVGAYCSHCAIVNQILPIEWLGRPMRGTAFSDRADPPCKWFIYKHPDAVPDRTFTEVGKQRPAHPGDARDQGAGSDPSE
jgi:hypothetical protein